MVRIEYEDKLSIYIKYQNVTTERIWRKGCVENMEYSARLSVKVESSYVDWIEVDNSVDFFAVASCFHKVDKSANNMSGETLLLDFNPMFCDVQKYTI